jgi:hypothetical protein
VKRLEEFGPLKKQLPAVEDVGIGADMLNELCGMCRVENRLALRVNTVFEVSSKRVQLVLGV